jgi:diguanylate cyclase (GGDEF)-like protein
VRRLSLLALLIGIALLPLVYGIAVNDHDRDVAEVRRTLAAAAASNAGQLDAYFQRARSVILLTANQPGFRHFDEEPGSRVQKVSAGGGNVADVTAALRYLERLYPTSIGEACFIDRTGAEVARVVRGKVAPSGDLSTKEQEAPFFASTFALRTGEVYQARPYVSPDTKEWVIANATPIPSRDGVKRSIVHFEVTIESFRRAAASNGAGFEVRVVDAASGRVVLDGEQRQRVGAPLGVPGDRRFAALARGARQAGIVEVSKRTTAYRRVHRATGNANDWLVVATAIDPAPSLVTGLGPASIAMLVLALVLVVLGAFGLRAQRRELQSAAETDILTQLGNRRRLLDDLERRIAGAVSEPAVLILLDLNGFKAYNDAFGHLAGDALLRRLANALAAAVAPAGRAYRLGGDEFCVLADARAFVEHGHVWVAALSERGDGFDITAASGVVRIPGEAHAATEALQIADQRMYAGKRAARPQADDRTKDVLMRVLAERRPDLGDHVDGVAELAQAVARWMGLDRQASAQVGQAAELHDIGKIALPDSILDKTGPLDAEEWAFMRRHTIIGERILAGAPALGPVGELVRASHEHYDGRGYPDGLAREEIPLGARIIAVCDAYDAMLSNRPYSPSRTPADACAELHRCAGAQFDPTVVAAFTAVLATRRVPLAA